MRTFEEKLDKWDEEDKDVILHKGNKKLKKEPFKRDKRRWLEEDEDAAVKKRKR